MEKAIKPAMKVIIDKCLLGFYWFSDDAIKFFQLSRVDEEMIEREMSKIFWFFVQKTVNSKPTSIIDLQQVLPSIAEAMCNTEVSVENNSLMVHLQQLSGK